MQLSEDIKKMNMTDKFIMLEQLWEDMSKDKNNDGFTPEWHIDILDSREKYITENKSSFSDISEVKKRLQNINFV